MAENGSYGRELALRAYELLNELESAVKFVEIDEESEGSLRPTFLLSMAMPIIIQPYERFFSNVLKNEKSLVKEFDGYEKGSDLARLQTH